MPKVRASGLAAHIKVKYINTCDAQIEYAVREFVGNCSFTLYVLQLKTEVQGSH